MARCRARRAPRGPSSLLSAAAAALLLGACADDPRSPLGPAEADQDSPPTEDGARLPGLVVSEPHTSPAAAGSGATAGTDGLTYVSLAPGTLPEAVSVRIRNTTTSHPPLPPVAVVDGGFDPVGVPASAEDRLELAIRDAAGAVSFMHVIVPIRRPPVVVRTNPPRGRTDVALFVRPIVVFSEPIDGESLDTASVRLLLGDVPVGGVVTLVPGNPFTVEFAPDRRFEPGRDYELVVTTAVLDLDGDALEEEHRVPFRTTSSTDAGPAAITIVSGNEQRGRAGQELPEPFVVRVTDGQGAALAGVPVTWSVDWPWGVLDGLWDVCDGDPGAVEQESSHSLRTTVTTDGEGFARVSFVPTSFNWSAVRAELAGVEDVRVWFRVDATDAGASMEVVSGDGQEASAGPSFVGEPLVVRVKDGQGQPVPNVTVYWSVAAGVGVLGGDCSRTFTDWWSDETLTFETFTFWYVRTGADGTAAIEFRPRAIGVGAVFAWVLGTEAPATFTFEATSLVIGLSDGPSGDTPPSFLGPHFTSDAGVPVGRVVEFWNRRPAARIVSTSAPPGGASFDSGTISEDERFRFVPDIAGTWEFRDEVSGTTGTVTARSPDAGHGTVFVSNVTTGGAFDVDGYRVTITAPGYPPRTSTLELNRGLRVAQIAAGPATIEIADLAANCFLAGGPKRSVTVERNAQIPVEFAVTCTPPPELASVPLVFSRGRRLWSMNADGSDPRQLTSVPSGTPGWVTDIRPVVSPDGSRIAFSRVLDEWEGFRVFLRDTHTSQVTQLTDDRFPDVAWSWSPDGTRIATQTGWGEGRIDVVATNGERTSLLNGGGGTGDGRSPAWSTNGEMIAFYRFNHLTDAHEVWVMDADGRNHRHLRRLHGYWFPGGPFWSTDGSRILFADGFDEWSAGRGLWSMNADGSDAELVWNPGPLDVTSFSNVSPDGRLLSMTVRRHPWDAGFDYGPLEDVYLLDLETGEVVRVTADGLSSAADFLR